MNLLSPRRNLCLWGFLWLGPMGFWTGMAQEPAPAPQAPAPKTEPVKKSEPVVKGGEELGFEQIEILVHVIELIRQEYHDESRVTYQRLIDSALEGMLANLDPHCQFMPKEIFEQMQKETGGTYDGVGITVAFRNEMLTIVAVREEGPAARAGILPGDQIIKVNEIMADKLGLAEAMDMMRGKPGQPLKLTLRRPANNQLLEVSLIREVIREATVTDVMLLPPRYAADRRMGYLRLTQFGEGTVRELVDALNDLEQKGMEALVMDLRNNPGGLLTAAVNTCGEFVPPDTVVLTTEGRNASRNTKTYRTPPGTKHAREYPVAILVNHGSASGAEVVSGALQDLKRALIIGETTFGKGSVQQIIPVPNSEGNAIRLTTARYYTPSKRTIHEHGVEPDIVSTMTPQDERNLMMWFRRDTLAAAELKQIEQWEDRQLARAADSLKGALLFSGTFAGAKAKPAAPATPAKSATPVPPKPAAAAAPRPAQPTTPPAPAKQAAPGSN
ncbi:MAG: S41 family peptidase [Verrucomicrobia bacterium]|nr:S41 family peptidase [Verrucomicrobiota bacterium]